MKHENLEAALHLFLFSSFLEYRVPLPDPVNHRLHSLTKYKILVRERSEQISRVGWSECERFAGKEEALSRRIASVRVRGYTASGEMDSVHEPRDEGIGGGGAAWR
ncbi:hypothetical protein FCM35_KLT08188 [Carex littledalei]|uniref:Uncharacterized protein n=1 Tax=Carex littledalei TaxID=544730 RepID=A0A833QX29_9POAL|nr:hypothetical protein FCM35_KLT08188 [Carex littledalei]